MLRRWLHAVIDWVIPDREQLNSFVSLLPARQVLIVVLAPGIEACWYRQTIRDPHAPSQQIWSRTSPVTCDDQIYLLWGHGLTADLVSGPLGGGTTSVRFSVSSRLNNLQMPPR